MLRIYVVLLFVVLGLCEDQDFLSVLKRQTGVSTFVEHLEASTDLLNQVADGSNGPFTVLVPDDAAFSSWASDNTQLANNSDYIEALMKYHFLRRSLASADFENASFFVHSLLDDKKYANVTGGQVVHMTTDDGKPAAISGFQAASHIKNADILFQGGIIHIVDTPLIIPESVLTTMSRLKLTDLLALLNKGNFLDPNAPSVRLVNEAPDLAIFAPNNPQFGASFTGFDSLNQEQIRGVLNYSVVQSSPPMYSSEFKNGTSKRNLAQLSLLFTDTRDGFYIDAAKHEKSDYLIANGVLQIISQILRPDLTGEGPAILPDGSAGEEEKKKNNTAVAVGIGVGVGALVLGLVLGCALYIRIRKKRNQPVFGNRRHRPGQQRLPEQDTPGIPAPVPRTIGGGADRGTMELTNTASLAEAPPPRYGTHELDNKTFSEGRSHGSQNSQRQNISVFEIRNADGSTTTTTTTRPTGRFSRLDEPLPPKPMTPQEIDGTETGRISITITGERPRHLGFQARY